MNTTINGFEDYLIYDDGRIFSTKTNKWRKAHKKRNGYYGLTLWKDGTPYNVYVHRLVAKAFLPNPTNLPQVNHINEDKSDNRVENLEWCSSEYNTNYGSRNTKVSQKMTNGKLSQQVKQYTLDGILIKVWKSTREIKRQNNWEVWKCLSGKNKTAYGYKWTY